MSTATLSDEQWSKIVRFLREHPGVYVGQEEKCRLFVEAVLRILRSGEQWRFLPQEYGKWNSIYKRYAGWCERGIWDQMLEHFADDPDMECLMLDGTVIRAHPCAAGAPHKRGGQAQQALGYSRGGFSTKIHIIVDALGNPLDFVLTGGQRHENTQAETLLRGRHCDYVIADKGYDSDAVMALIEQMGAIAVIPARKNRTEERDIDRHIYKERHLVECFINKIKWFRRIFSRFEKLASRFLGFLSFASTLIWLR